jgi:hypothetical protein
MAQRHALSIPIDTVSAASDEHWCYRLMSDKCATLVGYTSCMKAHGIIVLFARSPTSHSPCTAGPHVGSAVRAVPCVQTSLLPTSNVPSSPSPGGKGPLAAPELETQMHVLETYYPQLCHQTCCCLGASFSLPMFLERLAFCHCFQGKRMFYLPIGQPSKSPPCDESVTTDMVAGRRSSARS